MDWVEGGGGSGVDLVFELELEFTFEVVFTFEFDEISWVELIEVIDSVVVVLLKVLELDVWELFCSELILFERGCSCERIRGGFWVNKGSNWVKARVDESSYWLN